MPGKALTIGAIVAAIACGAWFSMRSLFTGSVVAPRVSGESLVVDRARRETLVRAVRASGVLVPNRTTIAATASDGVLVQITVRAGEHVDAGTIVARLTNPDLEAAVIDARAEVTAMNAQIRGAREEARASQLDRDGAYRTAVAQWKLADNEERADLGLVRDGLIGTLTERQARVKLDEARGLREIASRKIDVDRADAEAKVAIAQAAVDRAAATLAADRAHVAALVVRAGNAGIVESISATVGEHASSGMEVARIAGERDLKAVLDVAESDIHGVRPGLRVALDTNGSAASLGHVDRIAPVAVNGSIAVDVMLDDVNQGLRPAQNVDGTIELLRLPRVLTIARPATATDGATVTLFRLSSDGTQAFRTRVRLGSGSLDRVEVRGGLAAGDRAIVSDTSAFENTTKLIVTPN